MVHKIHVQPLGWLARIADILMIPIMYLLAGTLKESPQQTHFWNNTKLSKKEVAELSHNMMVSCKGDCRAVGRKSFLDLRFHLPIFGGWKQYVVLRPNNHEQDWYVGWVSGIDSGIIRIELSGSVRMLIGPGEVKFFGINSDDNKQIAIKEIGRGHVGGNGPHSKIPLL